MQLDLYDPSRKQVLKVEFTDLLVFGNRADVFLVDGVGEGVSGVVFLEPSEGVMLVTGHGHITKF